MRRRMHERGQAIVLVALTMTVLLGLGALAIDVGSWFHSQRQLQSSVDAAALAGAQDLPLAGGTVAYAQTTASNVLTTNLSANPDAQSGTASAPTFPSTFSNPDCSTSNCLAVDVSRPAKGILARVMSPLFGSVNTHAHAQTFLGVPNELNNVSAAPVPIDRACIPPPTGTCTLPENNVTLQLDVAGTNNSVTPLLDLATKSASDPTITTNGVSTTTMNTWLTSGYPGALPVDYWYAITSGAHNGFKQSFQQDAQSQGIILIPIFDKQYPVGSSNPTAYHVIGFAAFQVTKVVHWTNGNNQGHILEGNFVNYIGSGLTGQPCGSTCQNFGVLVVGLDG